MAEEHPLVKLLGNEVVDNKGTKRTVADIANTATAVGIYFSAHWCGPCRAFTPVLAKQYPKLKKDKGLEIVFVSSDRDEASFNQYHGEMPWFALPFSDRQRKAALSSKYKVQGIPTFVIVDPKTGKLINKDGRSAVQKDPNGDDFPWATKTAKQLISKLIDNSGHEFTQAKLEHHKVGLYFSAHWCPPCRGFTPQLIKTYNKLKSENKDLEIVFISSDQSEAEFKQYFHEMPWLSIPFEDRKAKAELSELFDVEGIPTLIFLDWDSGKVINSKGRGAVSSDPDGLNYPWAPKAVNVLGRDNASDLNETAGVIAFVSGDAKAATAALTAVASEVQEEDAKAGEDNPTLLFYVDTDADAELSGKIKELMHHSGSKALGILNIPGGNFFWAESSDLSADNIRKFVKAFRSNSLQGTSLGD